MNSGIPLDETKHNITNWLITRIENLLPEPCSICAEEYCVKFGTQPPICIFLCGQSIHESSYRGKKAKYKDTANYKRISLIMFILRVPCNCLVRKYIILDHQP